MALSPLVFCDVRTALAQRRTDPTVAIVISVESDDAPLDPFFTDIAVVVALQPPAKVARLKERADAAALGGFRATFSVPSVPSLFVFGPNSRGPSLLFSGAIPTPDAFAAAFAALPVRARSPSPSAAARAPSPPATAPTAARRREPQIAVTAIFGAARAHKNFRVSRTVGRVRKWAGASFGLADGDFTLVREPGNEVLSADAVSLEAFGPVLEIRVTQKAKRRPFRWLLSFLGAFWFFGGADSDPAEFWQMKV